MVKLNFYDYNNFMFEYRIQISLDSPVYKIVEFAHKQGYNSTYRVADNRWEMNDSDYTMFILRYG